MGCASGKEIAVAPTITLTKPSPDIVIIHKQHEGANSGANNKPTDIEPLKETTGDTTKTAEPHKERTDDTTKTDSPVNVIDACDSAVDTKLETKQILHEAENNKRLKNLLALMKSHARACSKAKTSSNAKTVDIAKICKLLQSNADESNSDTASEPDDGSSGESEDDTNAGGKVDIQSSEDYAKDVKTQMDEENKKLVCLIDQGTDQIRLASIVNNYINVCNITIMKSEGERQKQIDDLAKSVDEIGAEVKSEILDEIRNNSNITEDEVRALIEDYHDDRRLLLEQRDNERLRQYNYVKQMLAEKKRLRENKVNEESSSVVDIVSDGTFIDDAEADLNSLDDAFLRLMDFGTPVDQLVDLLDTHIKEEHDILDKCNNNREGKIMNEITTAATELGEGDLEENSLTDSDRKEIEEITVAVSDSSKHLTDQVQKHISDGGTVNDGKVADLLEEHRKQQKKLLQSHDLIRQRQLMAIREKLAKRKEAHEGKLPSEDEIIEDFTTEFMLDLDSEGYVDEVHNGLMYLSDGLVNKIMQKKGSISDVSALLDDFLSEENKKISDKENKRNEEIEKLNEKLKDKVDVQQDQSSSELLEELRAKFHASNVIDPGTVQNIINDHVQRQTELLKQRDAAKLKQSKELAWRVAERRRKRAGKRKRTHSKSATCGHPDTIIDIDLADAVISGEEMSSEDEDVKVLDTIFAEKLIAKTPTEKINENYVKTLLQKHNDTVADMQARKDSDRKKYDAILQQEIAERKERNAVVYGKW